MILERTHKVKVERQDGMRSGFYLIGTPSDDSQVLGHIRSIPRRQIVLSMLEHGVCTFGEILVHINKAPSTLSWHLKRLSDVGIISVIHRQKCQLYRIVNSKLVSYVLSKYGQSLKTKLLIYTTFQKRMTKRISVYLQQMRRVRLVSCLSPCLVILFILLMFCWTSAISTIYTAQLQQAIAQTTPATTTKPSSSNSFLTYENNSTLGVKIQYPSNWQMIESEYNAQGVLFLSPSESNSDRFLESFGVSSSSLFNNNNNSVDELARRAISEHNEHLPDFQLLDTKLIAVKGNAAYLLEYKYTDLVFGQAMAMDIGMTNGDKVYVLSYLADPAKFWSYLPTIQKMIDSFEVQNIRSLA